MLLFGYAITMIGFKRESSIAKKDLEKVFAIDQEPSPSTFLAK
ncbi:MAG TPA: hypothetical protein VK890_04850 [Bacteroidia bacterium]|nr:hypothetical protein [Bacteroidia bacterium]